MEPVGSTSNSTLKPISDITGKSVTNSTLIAYNNIDFKSIINREIGSSYIKDKSGIQNSPQRQISDAKQAALNNLEYENFVSHAEKGIRPHSLHSKRLLKGFHPVPAGKAYSTNAVTHKETLNKSTLSDLSRNKNITKDTTVEKTDLNINGYTETDQENGLSQQIAKYKEDQLLTNPGGDNFFLERQENVIDNKFDQSTFSNRVGKDLFDSLSNLKNLAKDLGNGGETKYLDKDGNVRINKKVGLLKAVGNFFKNIASGFSFGAYNPDNEEAPVGIAGKVKHFFKKVFVQAMGKDLFVGVPQSMINVGEDVLFAGINLIETIPDATVGNTELGRKITTKVFDNVQVAMDFATDIMPGGEASTRMRTALVKKIKNLNNPEKDTETPQYVRSTPFRKVIETLSFFMPFRI